ncbi:PHP domain-containing protein [Candidatus Woesearchaeota archaeon]|nr:PHP domain-containing protein [Candidatus Woesearchaeota archaeon]
MPKNIDLQCHTTASDGALTPKGLVRLALRKKLKAIAITDHDSVGGIDEALSAAKGKGIEVIPGVEISCDDKGFVDTHILGLFINHKNKSLNSLLRKAQQYRESQKKDIIKKFQKLGFKITYQEVKKLAKGEIGRPHIAKAILKNNPDKVNSIDKIFDKYLAVGKKAYAERKNKIGIKQAINAIHSAKGFALISHPGVYSNFSIEEFIKYFIKNGGDGLETYYNYESSRYHTGFAQSSKINKKFRNIAGKYRLLETGGSDFHGREGQVLGKLKVPYKVLAALKNRRTG